MKIGLSAKVKKSKRDSEINLKKKKIFLFNKLFANNKIYGIIKQIIFLENIVNPEIYL